MHKFVQLVLHDRELSFVSFLKIVVLFFYFTCRGSDDILEQRHRRRQDRRFSQARFKAKEQTRVVRRHIEPSMRDKRWTGRSSTSTDFFFFVLLFLFFNWVNIHQTGFSYIEMPFFF